MPEPLQLNDQLEMAYNALNNGIMIVDKELSILFMNHWLRKQLPEEMQKTANLIKLLDPDRAPAIVSKVNQVIEFRKPVMLSSVFHKWVIPLGDNKFQDGRMRQQGMLTPVVVEKDGKQERAVMFQIRDVSNILLQVRELELEIKKHRQTQEELKVSKEQAEAASIAKTQFLANMSHEIRTPLNSIVGFSQILLSHKAHHNLTKEFKQFIENIKVAGDSLSELINNILDLAKIEAGKMVLVEEDLNLKQLFQSMYHVNKGSASEKKLSYHYEYDAKLPEFIHADRTKLNQILMNLVSNAIKFTPEGKQVTLQAIREKEMLLLQVIDEGIGIHEERHSSIFSTFEQADGSTTRHYGGTGLGLAITRQIVDLMQGTIALESEEGKGSTFSVRVPLKEASSSAAQPIQIELDQYHFSKNNVILVVEDNLMNQKMMEVLFDNLELPVHFANNGTEGVQKALQLKEKGSMPDLILMDMHMPDMDGMEATRRLREHSEFASVPIVAVSADYLSDQQRSALETGISDYLTKPIDLTKLLPVLINYLQMDQTPSQPHSDQQPSLPDSIKNQMTQEIETLEEYPIYYGDEIISQAEKIMNLCEGFDSPHPSILQSIIDAVYQGDEMLLKASIHNFKEGLAASDSQPSVTDRSASVSTDSSETAEVETIVNAPELLQFLENDIQTAWQEICEVLVIDEAENFARQMTELGQEHHCSLLKEWGEKQLFLISMFDTGGLLKSLKEFPDVLERLRKT
ncbi:MAG: response regulator [SAR324 cluster bacterium]|nr:response regulator [SAR324 cluster bacterium]